MKLGWQEIIIALILLTISLVKNIKKVLAAKERRIREEKRREAERQSHIRNEQSAVSSNLRTALSASTPDYQSAKRTVDFSDPSVREYAIEQVKSYNSVIKDRILKSSEQGKLDEALAALEFYCHYNPGEESVSKQKASIEELVNACESGRSLIISSYGYADQQILERIYETSPDICRNSMKEMGIQFCLWFFAIKKPFDSNTFSEILVAADQIKGSASRPLPDAVQSSIYVDTKQRGLSEIEVATKYSGKVRAYINSTDDPYALLNYASGIACVGNALLEGLILKKLLQVKPDVPESVRQRYKKLQELR